MRRKILAYIKNNPNRISFLLWIYNHTIGRNRIKISPKNSVKMGAVLMKKTNFSVKGINNAIIIDDLSRLHNCSIYIRGNNNTIFIDREVCLYEAEFFMDDDNNEISIGAYTSIHGATELAAIEGTAIHIGSDCMFSGNIHFRTGDSHSVVNLQGERINASENIVIGNHVWVGTRVLCLKGVQVANHSIIGAGSLVTKKFGEDNVVLAGNPARIVKRDIDWRRERVYDEANRITTT